jgi:hypothetical protein
MKLSRKIFGFAVAITLVATQFTTAFAADPNPGPNNNADGSYQGTDGNVAILARSYNSVVVPTTLKVALNPNGYDVVLRYHDVTPTATGTKAVAGTTYYIKRKAGIASKPGKYEKYTETVTASTDLLDDIVGGLDTDIYESKVFTADVATGQQVVSLNYGIINKSTTDKIVKVDFSIGYTEKADTTGTKPIEFVDAETKAQAKSGSNSTGADKNEPKMFLQVQSANDTGKVKVRENYKRVLAYTDINATASTAATIPVYTFTKSSGAVTGYELIADNSTLGVADGKIPDAQTFAKELATYSDLFILQEDSSSGYFVTPETTAAQLSDAIITPVTAADVLASPRTFAAGAATKSGTAVTDAANTGVVYSLLSAGFGKYANAVLDFDSTQQDFDESEYCKTINGYAGFTFAGNMNPVSNCDWTKANTSALTITPRYTIRDPKSSTEATGINGTSSQCTLAPAITVDNDGLISIYNAGCTSAQLKALSATSGTNTFDLIGNDTTVTTDTTDVIVIQMGSSWKTNWTGQTFTVSVTLADNTTTLTSSAVTFP